MSGPLGVGEVSLVERDAEFAALVSALDAARAGAGSLVLVEGPAGIGKTALAEAVRERALQDGFRVLFARGSEFEREYPFGVARRCLEPVVRRQDDRERLLRGAAGLAEPVLLGVTESVDVAPLGVLHGLYWVVTNLSEVGPVAIVVDDAHWADEPSLRFLAYLARRIDSLRVALVVGARREKDAGGAADPGLAELRREAGRAQLELQPLGREGVARLLRDSGAKNVDGEFARACHAATGGNPFLVEELARTLIAEGVPFTATSSERVRIVAPATVAEAVAATLAELSPEATALARAGAVLGDGAALAIAAEVADLPIDGATAAAAELVRAGLLRDERELVFRHPILSSAVTATLSAIDLAAAHGRAAEILRARGAAPERVALQLLHTAASSDERVVAELRMAARSAHAGGAPETAAVLLERALAEPPSAEARGALLLELGRAELASGRARAAVLHLTEAHRWAAEPVTRGTAVLLLYTATAGDAAHQGKLADMAEAAIAELRERNAELALRLLGLLALTGRVEDVPEPAGDTTAEADFLGRLVLVRMRSGASAAEIGDLALRASRQVDALAVGDSTVVGFSGMFLGLLWADRLDDAERVADRAIAAARRRGAVAFFASAMTVRARARRGAGRLRDAEADARTALDAALDFEWAFARGLAPLLTTLVCQGRADEAARELADALKGGEIPQAPPMVAVLLARMWVRAARREHAAALADWHEALRWIQPRRPNAGWIEDLAVVAEVQLASGDRDGAWATAVESQSLADAWGTPRAIGMALHTRARVSDDADAIGMLRRAVDLLAGSPARFEEAKARVSLGSALRRAGHRVESREPLREGYELARHCGADGLAELARSELRASGIRLRREAATGADSLTPSERRIAGMAAAGLSNPEIAQDLFLTVKTIEMHLTRSYRKLDIRGRAELARALGAPV